MSDRTHPSLRPAPKVLIEAYFAAEQSAHRDALLAALVEHKDEEVDRFLAAMAVEDDDPYMRVQAAGALLARSGDGGSRAALWAAVDGDDDQLAALAVDLMLRHDGAATFGPLWQRWLHPEMTCLAMSALWAALEDADLDQALAAGRAWLAALLPPDTAADDVPLDQIEAVVMAMAHRGHRAAEGELVALQARAQAAHAAGLEPAADLVSLLEEGLVLLNARPEGPPA